MRIATRLLVLACCFLPALNPSAETVPNPYPDPPFSPPAGHPRVLFTAADLPRLRANAEKPQNAAAWAAFQENLRPETDGVLPAPVPPARANVSAPVLVAIESMAYDFVLRGNADHGRRAVRALRNYVESVVYSPGDYNNTGQTVYTIGVVYDWCHPLLTPEDRGSLIDAALATAARMEIGWPPVRQGNVTGHGPEGQLMRDLLCFAVAVHDERPDIYAIVAGRFFDRFIPPKLFMYPARMHTQGNHYTSYRFQWELYAAIIFEAMGLPDVFGPDQRHVLDWLLYARRPDGQVLRDGDTHINNKPLDAYFTGPLRSMFLAGNFYSNPWYKAEALRALPGLKPMTPTGNQTLTCNEILIFNDPDLQGRPFDGLPLTRYFPYPKGAMIARTGWDDGVDSPAVVAEFKINEWYFANHQHLDAGAFQIYYRGVLANDSGYYQAGINKTNSPLNDGSSGYGSLHDINYNKRSIAHNTLLVKDPAERFISSRWRDFPIVNDGGQRFPNEWAEPSDHEVMLDPANGYRIATVLGHWFGPDQRRPDFSYLKGDLARAYSGKVAACERSFAFLNLQDPHHPAALVVFDRVVSANPEFRKSWLLHGLEEPAVTPGRIVFMDTRPGYRGRLTADTLMPAADNLLVEVTGGPGREFLVDGTNYPAVLRPEGQNEGHGWRVEVSPLKPATTDYFLHVLQVGDHTPDTPPLEVRRIETAAHAGAVLAGRVVLFGKGRDRLAGPVGFEFPGTGAFKLLVADLQAGEWQVTANGIPVGRFHVAADSGTLCFDGPAGAYRLEPINQ